MQYIELPLLLVLQPERVTVAVCATEKAGSIKCTCLIKNQLRVRTVSRIEDRFVPLPPGAPEFEDTPDSVAVVGSSEDDIRRVKGQATVGATLTRREVIKHQFLPVVVGVLQFEHVSKVIGSAVIGCAVKVACLIHRDSRSWKESPAVVLVKEIEDGLGPAPIRWSQFIHGTASIGRASRASACRHSVQVSCFVECQT